MLDFGQGQLRSVRRLRHALIATTILVSGLAAPAFGQSIGQLTPPPVRVTTDANGVDVIRGAYYPPSQDIVSIGPNDHHGLSLDRIGGVGGFNSLLSAIENIGGKVVVTIGLHSDSFTQAGNIYTATEGNGATLTNSGGQFIYTARDGTVARFTDNTGSTFPQYEGDIARPLNLTYPDGTVVTYTVKQRKYCPGGMDDIGGVFKCQGQNYFVTRVSSVTNSNGYQLKPVYAIDQVQLDPATYPDWRTITDVIAINNQIEACSPTADTCALTGNWPKQSTSTPPPLRVTTTNDANGRVGTAVNHGISYAYTYADVGTTRTTTVTGPTGSSVWVGDTASFLVSSVKDELNRTTAYAYDASGRVTQITYPEGNAVQYGYDARGNITTTTAIAKAGSGLANIATSASYPASCTTTKTCNKPIWTKDAKLNQTDYTYDTTHGGVLTVTAPAAASGGIRPQVRYSYGLSNGMSLLTGVSTCQTTASCAGALDEVKTSVIYGGAAQNYLPTTISSGAGNGSLTATASITYDNIGNPLTVDGPLAGNADTTRTVYDNQRRVVGVIGPDPDGAGALKNRAQRVAYNGDWQVTTAEVGTTVGQTDTAFAAFVPLQQTVAVYDANAFKLSDTLQVGTTKYALTQYSYDSKGRLDCAAVRMNVAVYGALPAACTASTLDVNIGPDRITKTIYDAANQVTKVQTAYGTAEQSDEVTIDFTLNGLQRYVMDGQGNMTAFAYDGLDRLQQKRFPLPTQGSQATSTTDYEYYSYDANGNVTQRRLRDGQVINYTFDNLNRVTLKDVPNTAYYENDISYSYDLPGRMLSASNAGTRSVSMAYDALGRQISETSYVGTRTMQYDLAGRMTRLTHTDGYYVTQDYLVTGEVSAIRENGATSGIGVLGAYAYNDLSQMTTLTRGNGTVTSYAYDLVARLEGMKHDLTGTTWDALVGRVAGVGSPITYNPASQITSLSRDNDLYKWNGHYNVDRPYTVNGLNQLTTAGATALGYDGRGNLISSGTTTYGYSSENRLATGSGPTAVSNAYDPLGRLSAIDTAATTVNFDYAGSAAITELDWPSYNIKRRYVYGPGADSPLVWYEGSGTTDRRWLIPDERGSIVAVTNASGNAIAVNTYDEYGIPGATNLGRFQYTGQAWLPELGMYYYKARIYSPTLGRFMQSDPIGYGDGMNMYGYVGGDPVNNVDPSGLAVLQPNPDVKPIEPCAPGAICVTAQKLSGEGGTPLGAGAFIGAGRSTGASGGDSGFGGGGGGGGGDTTPDCPTPVAATTNTKSTAERVADTAELVGTGADVITVVAELAGLATAPTGAGPLVAGGTAFIAKGVSLGSNVVAAGANVASGNYSRAAGNVVGFALGTAAGKATGAFLSRLLARSRAFGNLSASQLRKSQVANDAASAAAQKLLSTIGCSK
jgi:RHS repeat-associated protein